MVKCLDDIVEYRAGKVYPVVRQGEKLWIAYGPRAGQAYELNVLIGAVASHFKVVSVQLENK